MQVPALTQSRRLGLCALWPRLKQGINSRQPRGRPLATVLGALPAPPRILTVSTPSHSREVYMRYLCFFPCSLWFNCMFSFRLSDSVCPPGGLWLLSFKSMPTASWTPSKQLPKEPAQVFQKTFSPHYLAPLPLTPGQSVGTSLSPLTPPTTMSWGPGYPGYCGEGGHPAGHTSQLQPFIPYPIFSIPNNLILFWLLLFVISDSWLWCFHTQDVVGGGVNLCFHETHYHH